MEIFQNIDVHIKKEGNTSMPKRATDGSAGFDLRIDLLSEGLFKYYLESGEVKKFSTGWRFYIRNPNIVGVVVMRSGISTKYGIQLKNQVGIIDSDYHGIVYVTLENTNDKPYELEHNERVCQILFMPVIIPNVKILKNMAKGIKTSRDDKGHGSTGKF